MYNVTEKDQQYQKHQIAALVLFYTMDSIELSVVIPVR